MYNFYIDSIKMSFTKSRGPEKYYGTRTRRLVIYLETDPLRYGVRESQCHLLFLLSLDP